jgi:hypothetical protein
VIERLQFTGRESKRDVDFHRDTYRVTQHDARTGIVIWQGQRIFTVWKRIGKTYADRRSGSHGNRFVNRQHDPSRAKGGG